MALLTLHSDLWDSNLLLRNSHTPATGLELKIASHPYIHAGTTSTPQPLVLQNKFMRLFKYQWALCVPGVSCLRPVYHLATPAISQQNAGHCKLSLIVQNIRYLRAHDQRDNHQNAKPCTIHVRFWTYTCKQHVNIINLCITFWLSSCLPVKVSSGKPTYPQWGGEHGV